MTTDRYCASCSARIEEMAFEDFMTAALDAAIDLLQNGDQQTRAALIRSVLSTSMKTRGDGSGHETEKMLADTRAMIADILKK